MRKILATLAISGLAAAGFAGVAIAEPYYETTGSPESGEGSVTVGDTDYGYITAEGNANTGEGDVCASDNADEVCLSEIPVEGIELAAGATLYVSESGVVLAGDEDAAIHGYAGVEDDPAVVAACGDYSEGNGEALGAPEGDPEAECITG